MPQPLSDFDMKGLSTGYDPVAGMEQSSGYADQALDDSDDEGLNVASQETDDDLGSDDAVAQTEDTETEDDDEAVEVSGEEGDPADGDADSEADTGDDDQAAVEEEDLVPGVDPKLARQELKEKTQERIRTLANKNRDSEQKLRDLQAKFETLSRQNEQRPDEQTMHDAAEAAGVELDAETIKGMWDKAMDGDLDSASTTFTDIMQKVAEQAIKQATTQSQAATTQQQQMNELNKTVESLVTDYSQLDPESPDFDESLALEVRDLRDFYIVQKGMAPAEALTKAAERELTLRGMWGQEDVLNDEGKVDVAAETRKRNSQVAKEKLKVDQPAAPRAKGEGQAEQKRSIMDMTDEEFDAMSDVELEKLTGTQYR